MHPVLSPVEEKYRYNYLYICKLDNQLKKRVVLPIYFPLKSDPEVLLPIRPFHDWINSTEKKRIYKEIPNQEEAVYVLYIDPWPSRKSRDAPG